MMLATEKKQVDKLWDVIVDTYGEDQDTQYFLLEIQNMGTLEWALKKAEHIESDLAFLKHTKGVQIYEETIRDATLMRRMMEVLTTGQDRGQYLGAGDDRLRAGVADAMDAESNRVLKETGKS